MIKILKRIFMFVCMCCILILPACKEEEQFASGNAKYNFSINTNEIRLEIGEKFQVFATYGNEEISYSSSNTDVATVSESGEIVAVNEGTAFIKVEADKDSTNVKVIVEKPLYTIELDEENSFVVVEKASKTLSVSLYREGVIVNEKVNFTCENSQVKITELTNGSAVIIANSVGNYEIKITHASGAEKILSVKVLAANATKLAKPTNVAVNGNQISWAQTANASGYEVKLGDGAWTLVQGTTYEITDATASRAYIRAVSDGFNYYTSDVVSVELAKA